MEVHHKKMGLLVVGTGYLGAQRAAASALRTSRLRLVAVTDRDPASAERVAAKHGVVAVPELEAGKHVLCEKPLTIRADEARALATLADESRLRLATGFNHRFYPPVRDALALAGSWSIGRVESVRAEIGHLASTEFLKSWHTEVAQSGGGTLMDNGPHACDLIRRFLGEVVLAKGFIRQEVQLPPGCETEGYGLFRNHDNAVAELHASWAFRSGYLNIDVRGSEGFLRVETAPWRLTGSLADGRQIDRHYLIERTRDRLHRLRFGCETSLVRELDAFASPIDGQARPGATGWDGCRATEMIQAIYQSDRTGDEVHLKPLLVHLPAGTRRRALRDRNREPRR
jgi:predicted dehydrogenase